MEISFTNFDKDKAFYEPKKGSDGASGYDLYAIVDGNVLINPGETKIIDTNIAVQFPHGVEGQVRSRSGLAAKNGIFVLNAPATIDSDYRGPIKVILSNFGKEDFIVTTGDRIAQLVFAEVMMLDLQYTLDILDTQSRGIDGFGSTGIR